MADRALAATPRHSWTLRSQIAFLGNARRIDEAAAAIEQAVALLPDDPDLLTTASPPGVPAAARSSTRLPSPLASSSYPSLPSLDDSLHPRPGSTPCP
ncbi:hypothetical protein ACFPJ1_22020 [Kribbella qitaiheensis]|uniref:hypothetical protein n=1 Tax=Kribbella qitaiheensis TaxID=1544730 RepID=UPI00360EDC75